MKQCSINTNIVNCEDIYSAYIHRLSSTFPVSSTPSVLAEDLLPPTKGPNTSTIKTGGHVTSTRLQPTIIIIVKRKQPVKDFVLINLFVFHWSRNNY